MNSQYTNTSSGVIPISKWSALAGALDEGLAGLLPRNIPIASCRCAKSRLNEVDFTNLDEDDTKKLGIRLIDAKAKMFSLNSGIVKIPNRKFIVEIMLPNHNPQRQYIEELPTGDIYYGELGWLIASKYQSYFTTVYSGPCGANDVKIGPNKVGFNQLYLQRAHLTGAVWHANIVAVPPGS